MVSQNSNNFFEQFGEVQHEKNYSKETSPEAILIDITERWQDSIRFGEGMFFDFSATPELKNLSLTT